MAHFSKKTAGCREKRGGQRIPQVSQTPINSKKLLPEAQCGPAGTNRNQTLKKAEEGAYNDEKGNFER